MASRRILLKEFKTVFTKSQLKYRAISKLLDKSDKLSFAEHQKYQLKQLKKIIKYAYLNVDYYKNKFKDLKIEPGQLEKIEDIKKIPILNKKTLREMNDSLLTQKLSRLSLVKVYTGGTTGSPLPLYRFPNDFSRERAFEDYILKMQGVDPLCRKVFIRGEVNDNKGQFHSYGRISNTLYLSSHNLSDDNLKNYVELINDFKPQMLYSLPSIAAIIADFIKGNNIDIVDSIKHALVPSENIYPFQRELIEDVFKCKIVSQYGHSEHCVIACPCEVNDSYHVLPQYGFAELLDEDDNWVEKDGEVGEIVATSFSNIGFPLIRYRTGDFAEYSKERCSCKRNYQLWKRIIGRGQAVALTKNSGKISIGSDLLCSIYNDEYAKIKQFKIEQNQIGELIIHTQPHKKESFINIEKFFHDLFDRQYPNCFEVQVIEEEEDYFNQTEKNLYFVQNIR